MDEYFLLVILISLVEELERSLLYRCVGELGVTDVSAVLEAQGLLFHLTRGKTTLSRMIRR